MRIDELTRPNSHDEVYNRLFSSGWKIAGSGVYAQVYTNPNKPYVLKVFDSDDVAYKNFLDAIKGNQNIHFPKLFGKVVKLSDSLLAIRMEKLEKPNKINLENVEMSEDVIARLENEIEEVKFHKNDNGMLNKTMIQIIDSIAKKEIEVDDFDKEVITDNRPLVDALAIIVDHVNERYKDFEWDLHPGNIMQRKDGTVVLTDPIC